MTTSRGPGRPSKGDRHTFITRVPQQAADRIMAEAERLGVTRSEYIAHVLAEAHGVDLKLPTRENDADQGRLPLPSAS